MVHVGERYGFLICLSRSFPDKDSRYGTYQCDCGKTIPIINGNVERGATKSCGCYQKSFSRAGNPHRKHSGKGTRLYHIWKSMRERCNNPNASNYERYGAKGTSVCKEWDDFSVFRDWALSHGYNEQLTIDRIDGSRGYTPDNCRWSTYKEQARNLKSNHMIEYAGETHCISEWAEIRGMNIGTLHNRIVRGWSVERALNEPVMLGKNRYKLNHK